MVTGVYQLKVKNANEVSRAFELLDELKVHSAMVNKLAHSRIEEIKKNLRIQAMKAAHEKAQYMLEAIGRKVGFPLEVRENADMPYYNQVSNVALKQRDYAIPESVGEYKTILVKSSVYIKFGIEK